MADIFSLESKIKQMIDELKGLSATNGLANQAPEEVVITSVFLYKFLNDKFMSNLKDFAKDTGMCTEEILKNENDELDAFYDSYPQDVAFKYEDTIENLINRVSSETFYKLFDDALERISNYPQNEEFSVQSAEGTRKPLFTRITENVESSKRNNFAKNIFGIISQDRFDFGEAFKSNFDFYSTIFEYLIKDYNVAAGKYAEYFTPQTISSIIAKILVNMSPVEDKIYEVYDPSAGSGSLVLHLANELGKGSFGDKAQVYTQDISGKSTRFLRINMLLNGLTNSLDNIIEGDTLDTPAHYNIVHDPSSGVKRFDYITSNPPFKMDFSSTRNLIENKWADSEERDGIKRFFAGVPKIPSKKKESMAVYLCFMQHILWSLKDNGKAAIVCPTGFLTAKNGIELAVRKTIVDRHWLKGAISMPANIFANTGTNVSVIFIDKSNHDGEMILIDASRLGTKIRDGKNQKTILSDEDVNLIESSFIDGKIVRGFSVRVSCDDMAKKNYSFSAGQYFAVAPQMKTYSNEQFDVIRSDMLANLSQLKKDEELLNQRLLKELEVLSYDEQGLHGEKTSASGGPWKKVKLCELADLVCITASPAEHPDSEYAHYSIPAFDDGKYPAMEMGSQIESNKYFVPKNAILVSKLNPQFKRVWVPMEYKDNSICSTEFMPFVAKQSSHKGYLYIILASNEFQQYMIQCASASTGSRKRMPPELAGEFVCSIPTEENTLVAYDNVADIMIKLENIAIMKKRYLANVDEFLLPMLMNGQITF